MNEWILWAKRDLVDELCKLFLHAWADIIPVEGPAEGESKQNSIEDGNKISLF